MTRIRLVAPIFVLLVITGAAQGWAQSLGEVAKREEEKKKKSGKPPAPAKVYTDEDLKKARETGTSNVNFLPENENVTSSATSSSDQSGVREAGGGEGGGGERYWRSLAKRRRNAVEEAEQEVKQLESRIAALRNDMSPTNVQDPNRLQTQGRDLQKAQEDLEAARGNLEEARQSLANLEDEARRAGAMPGWVR
jgi:DNA repair exonuclease SbcCD ATPase subunit